MISEGTPTSRRQGGGRRGERNEEGGEKGREERHSFNFKVKPLAGVPYKPHALYIN